MLAEFFHSDAPEAVVARAVWSGAAVRLEADDPGVRAAVQRVFRPIPLVIDDAAIRSAGTSGPATLQPGSLTWFMEAARSRSEHERLAVRLVPVRRAGGWDPAAAYRTFPQAMERLERLGTSGGQT